MTVSSPLPPPPAVTSDDEAIPQPSVASIDASCRLPVLLLFLAGALWLGLGALLGVISAIKMHAPGFLAGQAWLTYGRVRPASLNALVYGFGLQTGFGVALWMSCRLGRNLIQGALAIAAGAVVWNVALAIGVVGILAGGSTGYELLEVPGAVTPILFCSYVLMGIWALITGHFRREKNLYVSQWFLLAAVLWFPWIYSTAQLLLVFFPVRGVLQAVVDGWYVHNFFELCLAPLGLAAIFYFIPKLLKRPLYSAPLALCGFWLLVLFGGWGGLRMGDPVPNWLGGVSGAVRLLLLVPALAFAVSWYRTGNSTNPKTQGSRQRDPLLRFFWVAACGYLLAGILETAGGFPGANRITLFTLYDQGLIQLKVHGFLLMALVGAIYYIAPRLVGCAWPSPGLIQFHFWCSTIGTLLTLVSLTVGGLLQGAGINEPPLDFMSVVRRTVPFLGMSTLGITVLFLGYAAFLVHLGKLLTVNCPCVAFADWLRRSLAASHGPGGAKA